MSKIEEIPPVIFPLSSLMTDLGNNHPIRNFNKNVSGSVLSSTILIYCGA